MGVPWVGLGVMVLVGGTAMTVTGDPEGPAGPEGEPEIRIERAERAWDRPAA